MADDSLSASKETSYLVGTSPQQGCVMPTLCNPADSRAKGLFKGAATRDRGIFNGDVVLSSCRVNPF